MTFDWRQSVQALRRDELPGEYDLPLLLAALVLAAFGLVMVGSASIAIADGEGAGPFAILLKHAAFLCGGAVLAAIAMRVPLRLLDDNSRVLLLLMFLLLLAVLVPGLGRRVNGATRWLNLGVMGFQVVEAVKLLMVVYMASYLVRRANQVRTSAVGILKPLGLLAVVVGLLLLQPDFGSAALVCAIVGGMIWLGGARARDIGGLVLLGTPVMALAALAEPYRVKRLTSFLDPFADPFRDGFQLSQALIAIGRGEWTGVGLGASVQKLYYLPEAHTDFILAVIAEELGLIGVVFVLCLFAFICARCFRVGLQAIEQGQAFAGYCAFGVGLWLSVQAMVSIGVNLGVLPTKGLTLPMVSAGGSSLLLTSAALGLVLRVGYETSRRAAEIALDAESTAGAPA
jgi:cell division protein FtsW